MGCKPPGLLLLWLIHAVRIRSQSISSAPTTASSTASITSTTSPTSSTTTTPSTTIASMTSTSSNALPYMSDNAGGGSGTDPGNYDNRIVNLYFVFLALILCVAGLGAFYMWRRKRRMRAMMRDSRDNSLARDLSAWDPIRSRRRYWQGRWRSADVSREEGLNEHGEAPPPYVPKTQEEESADGGPAQDPAIPLQTLSRDDAGLKPPDYTEADVGPSNRAEGSSSTREGSVRPADAHLAVPQPSSLHTTPSSSAQP